VLRHRSARKADSHFLARPESRPRKQLDSLENRSYRRSARAPRRQLERALACKASDKPDHHLRAAGSDAQQAAA
jgi:hypothetical protein